MMRNGVAIVVATTDEGGRPSLTRGWGPSCDQDAAVMSLMVTAPSGSSTLANLESNGAIAVTVSEPLTYETVQLKGRVEFVGAPSEDDRVAVLEHVDRFVTAVSQLGIVGGDQLFGGDLRLVRFTVDQRYDQTPGDRAGKQL